jgi:TPR repeat protein
MNGLRLAGAICLAALAWPAWGQATWAGGPAPGPELKAALDKADAGDPAPLVALADGGDANAQYFAGVLYVMGRGSIAADPQRGCAYEEKASASRADAMYLVGRCYETGAGGQQDKAKAEASYTRSSEMGYPQAKCGLGRMLMADPQQAERGLSLCKEAAAAGDADSQLAVGDAYFNGAPPVKRDAAEARKWYDQAARQNAPDAARKLGEMYANGEGGPKDEKKAMDLWIEAEKAGDPMVAILVADQLFSDLTGGRKPGPGKYGFKGGVPIDQIEVIEEWYRQAANSDPRPDVKKRANYALSILAGFKTAGQSAPRT